MKVTNQTNANIAKRSEQPLDLKKGESHTAIVKEQVSEHEAIVQIKGVDVKVEFDGKVPPEDKRVNIKVTDIDGNIPKVQVVGMGKEAVTTRNSNNTINHILTAAKGLSPELQKAVKILMDANIPINKDNLNVIKNFMANTSGSLDTKLETINRLVDKQLEITLHHLEAVHEALNKSIHSRINNTNSDDSVQKSVIDKDLAKLLLILQDKIGVGTATPEITQSLDNILQGVETLSKLGQEDSAIKTLTDTIKIVDTLNSASTETNKQSTFEALDRVFQDITDKSFQSKNNTTYTDEATPVNFQTKDFIVNEVTRRLSLATQQLKEHRLN